MTAALEIRDAVVRFGAVAAVDGVSLTVPRRSTLGIVGESGSGKTTLMRTVLGLQRLESGSIRVFGRERTRRREFASWSQVVQPIFQDPAASLSPRSRIGALLLEVAGVLHEPREATRRRAVAILGRLGVDEAVMEKYPHEISGGQARRVAIARTLLLKPQLVIADEPTAGLDVSVQGDLLNLLQALRQSEDVTFVVISHNLAIVRLVADDVAVMRRGQLVECGPAASVFAAPAHAYTRELIAAWPHMARGRAPLAPRPGP